MKSWADFHRFCHADVSGASVFEVENQLLGAAQDFCERTKVWRVKLDPVYLFPRIREYEVQTPTGSKIVTIAHAVDDMGTDIELLAAGTGGSGVRFFNETQFEAVPMGARRLVHFTAVLTPADDATGIDDRLFSQYGRIIGLGAKARLHAQDQRPYSAPALAEQEHTAFEREIARIQLKAAKSFSGAALRVTPQFF